MTRKLPWKRVLNSTPSSPKSPKQAPVRQAKVKRDDSDDNQNLTPSSTSIKRVKTSNPASGSATPNRVVRPGSTSPPPEPLSETYMVEGLEHDDLFRMVEDEFLSTAQQYTAHLHAAEYHRLKAASKTQNADTIRDISRPVVGRMTDVVKIKQDRKARLQKQKMAAKRAAMNKDHAETETEDDDDPWRSASLHGLMESPRKQAARLDNLTKVVTSTTRAAAGFDGAGPRLLFLRPIPEKPSSSRPVAKPGMKEPSETESDDDLDRPSPKLPEKSQPPKIKQTQNIAGGSLPTRQPTSESYPIKPQKQSEPTNDTGSSNDSGGDFFSLLKKRQEERKLNRERRKAAARTQVD
ncbi:hypothetical protein F4818DRAFT_441014 [Hypoxylon cercidicola]|nr:hypothetical protein F4818DRAFT_441014 [Hypoxylon cercidicola]